MSFRCEPLEERGEIPSRKAGTAILVRENDITPATKRIIYQLESPARVPRLSPRWRVGLICGKMLNFLAGVIPAEQSQKSAQTIQLVEVTDEKRHNCDLDRSCCDARNGNGSVPSGSRGCRREAREGGGHQGRARDQSRHPEGRDRRPRTAANRATLAIQWRVVRSASCSRSSSIPTSPFPPLPSRVMPAPLPTTDRRAPDHQDQVLPTPPVPSKSPPGPIPDRVEDSLSVNDESDRPEL